MCQHGLYHVHINERYNFNNLRLHHVQPLRDWFPAPTIADAQRTNLPLTDLVHQMLRAGHVVLINKVLSMLAMGTIETIVVMHLVCALGNSMYDRMHSLMEQDGACCLDPIQHTRYFKSIGVALRRSSRWVDGTPVTEEDVCKSSYWEMCTGRMTSKSDWLKEKKNRCDSTINLRMPDDLFPANKETNKRFLEHLDAALEEVFQQIIIPEDQQLSWPDFVAQRQLWVTSGSAGGERLIINGKKRRIDKKVLFEQLTSKEIIGWLDETPEITATGSEKYEISKARAIYGASNQSFMIITYLTRNIEKRMKHVQGLEEGLTELQELAAVNRRLTLASQPGVITTMIDYSDFNLQHTLAAQSKMFEVVHRIMIAKGMHPDMIKAAKWMSDACLNQKVKFPFSPKYYQVKQGMFSGVRSTHLENTIFNLCYFKVADDYVQNHLGIHPLNINTIHKGDDVWITNHNIVYAIALYAVMTSMGFVFESSKQLFGIIAEFLRVRYWPGYLMGYLGRSIGTLIERPLQSTDSNSPAVMLQALRSQINVCFRRGLSLEACELVWKTLVAHWSTFKIPKFTTVGIPHHIIIKPHNLGGLDLGPPRTMGVGGLKSKQVPTTVLNYETIASQVQSNMTKDYTSYLSTQLKYDFRIKTVQNYIHDTNIAGAASNKEKYVSTKHNANDTINWRKSLPARDYPKRSSDAYKEYLSCDEYDQAVYERLECMARTQRPVDVELDDTITGHIYQAIHSSPYRDLSTAQRATDQKIVGAAMLCILSHTNSEIRNKGLDALTTLLNKLRREIVVKILKGISGISNNLESDFHPVAISWLTNQGVSKAVTIALLHPDVTIDDWDAIVSRQQRLAVNAAVRQQMLQRIAKY